MTDAQVWIGDQGPFDADSVRIDGLGEEMYENWDEIDQDAWRAYEERLREEGTVQLAVYCAPEHVGKQCLNCWEVEAPWWDAHHAWIIRNIDSLERTTEIGAAASYRETILRQRNRRRLTEQRSKR